MWGPAASEWKRGEEMWATEELFGPSWEGIGPEACYGAMGQKKKKRRGGRAGPKERSMAGWAKIRE
jgi:hypothetical protein